MLIKFNIIYPPMQNKVIINFLSTDEKKAQYTAACKDLGISISEVCRRALDNTVTLSEKLKTFAPQKETGVADTQQEAHQ